MSLKTHQKFESSFKFHNKQGNACGRVLTMLNLNEYKRLFESFCAEGTYIKVTKYSRQSTTAMKISQHLKSIRIVSPELSNRCSEILDNLLQWSWIENSILFSMKNDYDYWSLTEEQNMPWRPNHFWSFPPLRKRRNRISLKKHKIQNISKKIIMYRLMGICVEERREKKDYFV